jgi:hypothetical protein
LIAGTRDLNREGSREVIDFIQKVRESGLEIASVTDYVLEQLDRIPEALNTLISNVGTAFDRLGDVSAINLDYAGKRLEALGQLAVHAFNAMIAEGRSYIETLKAMEGPLTVLFDKYEKFGLEVPKFLQPFREMVDLMNTRPRIFENLDASLNILQALRNSAYLTQKTFNTLVEGVNSFARALLGIEGNLNRAMHSMKLTQQQVLALLPAISQFVGAAALFGLDIPGWMRTFVAKNLPGVNWQKFQDIAAAQANAGIATVEQLKNLVKLSDKNRTGIRNAVADARKVLANKLTMIYNRLGDLNRTLGRTTGAQSGFHGLVRGPRTFFIEPGVEEYVNITPKQRMPTVPGGQQVVVVERPVHIEPVVVPQPDGSWLINFIQTESDRGRLTLNPESILRNRRK